MKRPVFKRGAECAWALLMAFGVGSSAVLGASCERTATPASLPNRTPTLRLYALSTVAGALEPCGCVKDMLGGVDHAAAYLHSQARHAPNSLLLGSGPLFFEDPEIEASRRSQSLFKADSLADSLREMRLSAWAPGVNDWAAGKEKLAELRAKSGAALMAANLPEAAQAQAVRVVDVGGLKVGLAGLGAAPGAAAGAGVSGHSAPGGDSAPGDRDRAVARLKAAKTELDKQGARVRVLLAALPRGQALRALDAVPGFQVAIVGNPEAKGEANEAPFPPVLVGRTLVVQSPNHLQGVAVVDLFVRGESYDFQDGSGIEHAERRTSLQSRIGELKSRIAEWESNPHGVKPADLEARRRDMKSLEQKLKALSAPAAPQQGSFFTYQLVEVRERLGSLPAVRARLDQYYARVNDHNREAFKDRVPKPASASESSYLGVEQCTACHAEERQFWDKTSHAKAYATLVEGHKEFNLDCVGCHVTGYEKPGGSTVTHVEELKSVQCEVCHGPGSRHVAAPSDPSLIVGKPAKTLCAPECHHPPHVKADWNVDLAWRHILGPGHGG